MSSQAKEKPSKFGHLPLSTSGPLECALKGTVLLNHPYFNKGSAFSKEERRIFELSGLLPQSIQTLEQQARRAYEQYLERPDDLAKNTFLTSMKEQNQVLYFKVRYTRHAWPAGASILVAIPPSDHNDLCPAATRPPRRDV